MQKFSFYPEDFLFDKNEKSFFYWEEFRPFEQCFSVKNLHQFRLPFKNIGLQIVTATFMHDELETILILLSDKPSDETDSLVDNDVTEMSTLSDPMPGSRGCERST